MGTENSLKRNEQRQQQPFKRVWKNMYFSLTMKKGCEGILVALARKLTILLSIPQLRPPKWRRREASLHPTKPPHPTPTANRRRGEQCWQFSGKVKSCRSHHPVAFEWLEMLGQSLGEQVNNRLVRLGHDWVSWYVRGWTCYLLADYCRSSSNGKQSKVLSR